MDIEHYIRFGAALILVLALMGLLALIMRKFNSGAGQFSLKDKRLSVVEQKMIDTRHKMVLIRRDNKEHLVILSQNGNTVIESGIHVPAKSETPTHKKDIPVETL